METFVRTVSEMEDTILVPSRLLDLSVGDSTDTIYLKNKQGGTIKEKFANTDLYRLYNIVNQMKVELLWSQEPGKLSCHEQDESSHRTALASDGAIRLGHNRCPSTTSIQSVKSASSITSITTASSASDCDSDNGIEMDSGLDNEEINNREQLAANQAAENFRRHLRGLHRSIERMTEAAQYLTQRYQADVGGQV